MNLYSKQKAIHLAPFRLLLLVRARGVISMRVYRTIKC